jgi:hypothetical protein
MQVAREISVTAYQRDWRVDMWRGLAIVMIFINHIPNNLFSVLTSGSWGFSDGAELFVFLSGISIAHVLITRFSHSRRSALSYLAGRSFILYVSHLGLVLAVATICALFLEATGSDALIQQMRLTAFFRETEVVIRRLITLTYQPAFMDILPLYVVVMGIAGLMFALFRRHWQLYVLASLSLYGAAAYWRINLPDYPLDRGWYFNPFCWQLIFVSGIIAVLLRDEPAFSRLLRSRALIVISASMIVLGIVGAAPWAYQGILTDWRPIGALVAPFLDKQYLSPLRYLHFLAVAHMAYLFVQESSSFRTTAIGQALCVIGRNALPAFALATVLSISAHAYLEIAGHDVFDEFAITALGICMLGVLITFLHRIKLAMRFVPETSAFAK